MDEPDEQGDPLRQYASTTLSVEEQIDRVWARQIFDNAMARLRGECAGLGKAHLFDRVSSYLHEDLENCSWDGIAAELGMNAGTVRTAATRIKQRWKFLIREEVRQTVADEKGMGSRIGVLGVLDGTLAAELDPCHERSRSQTPKDACPRCGTPAAPQLAHAQRACFDRRSVVRTRSATPLAI